MNFKKNPMDNKLMLDNIAQHLLELVQTAPDLQPIETENFHLVFFEWHTWKDIPMEK
jgi:hypothetical protein